MSAKAATQYRRNSKGEWVVCGHPTYVTVGDVEVRTAAGKVTTAHVTRLGREFRDERGQLRIYGYTA